MSEIRSEPRVRTPTPRDAAQVWRLVRDTGVLDLNSPYSYLLTLDHFGASSYVAELNGGQIVGVVTAFHPPENPETILVWQVGVSASMRGQGLAGQLLDAVADAAVARGAHTLETTITPTNHASQALFRSFAHRRGARCEVLAGYPAELFPTEPAHECAAHECEELYRIAPLDGAASAATDRSGRNPS